MSNIQETLKTTLTCSCGCGYEKNHILGKGNCYRKEATNNLTPINFRKERLINEPHKTPIDVCDLDGYTITVYTLKSQRCYSQHSDGRWSLPKNAGSINSLEGNW